jgi:enoyl-CoA hydratase/carnithine racemase
VTVEPRGPVGLVTLRRSAKRNALSMHLETELAAALASREAEDARVLVITGEEGCFSAGADLGELASMTPEAIARYYRTSGGVYERVASLSVPVIAAIEGYCVGGGLELALACDLRVAGRDALFALPEIGLGILPSSGGVTRLLRVVGEGRARELILTGRRFGVDEASAWGIVNQLTDTGAAVARALAWAEDLAQADRLALDVTKQVIAASADGSTAASLTLERLAYALLKGGTR